MISTILLVFAFVLFVLAGVGYPRESPPKYNLIGMGLALFVASILFGKLNLPNLP